MLPKSALALAMVLLLAACGGGTVSSTPSPPPPRPGKTPVRAPTRLPPPPARLQTAPGLEGVIGAVGADLVRQFGPARLKPPVWNIQGWHRHAGKPDVDWPDMRRRPAHGLLDLPRIGRDEDGQVGQRPQPGEIFD